MRPVTRDHNNTGDSIVNDANEHVQIPSLRFSEFRLA